MYTTFVIYFVASVHLPSCPDLICSSAQSSSPFILQFKSDKAEDELRVFVITYVSSIHLPLSTVLQTSSAHLSSPLIFHFKSDIVGDEPRTFKHVSRLNSPTIVTLCPQILISALLIKICSSQVKSDIAKDVPRTFPDHSLFKTSTLLMSSLQNVLEAYARRNPNIGYCQVSFGRVCLPARVFVCHVFLCVYQLSYVRTHARTHDQPHLPTHAPLYAHAQRRSSAIALTLRTRLAEQMYANAVRKRTATHANLRKKTCVCACLSHSKSLVQHDCSNPARKPTPTHARSAQKNASVLPFRHLFT